MTTFLTLIKGGLKLQHVVFVRWKRSSAGSGIFPCVKSCIVVSITVILFLAGCQPQKTDTNRKALDFHNRYRAYLVRFSSQLAEPVAIRDRNKIKEILHFMQNYPASYGDPTIPSIAVLDKHGVTIASMSQTSLTGTQNYGNYHVVVRVLQKRKLLQSSLYLQNGKRIYIVCAPILKGERVVGALIIGFDPDQLKQSGVSETDFMSLDFASSTTPQR